MISENPVEEDPGKVSSRGRLGVRNKVGIARETVADDPDRVVAVRAGELDDMIHCNRAPRPVRNVERAEQSERFVSRGLDATTDITCTNVVAYISVEAWP